MISISWKGDFDRTYSFLNKMKSQDMISNLTKYGEMGVKALSSATPVRTGKTAASWSYEIETTGDGFSIIWSNSNNNHGVYIAVLLEYGHGTNHGGYVVGRDYINPAMQPVFDEIAETAWQEVTNA